jgi:hypothetical protein
MKEWGGGGGRDEEKSSRPRIRADWLVSLSGL